MAVPRIYRGGGGEAIASYDFLDLAAGKAIVKFYAGDTISGGRLSTGIFYSHSGARCFQNDEYPQAQFETQFNKPIIVEGDAIICPVIGLCQLAAGSAVLSMTIKTTLHKIDGVSGYETLMGYQSVVYESDGAIGQNTGQEVRSSHTFDIARTKFKRGDKLRLTLSGSKVTAGWQPYFAHDPKNRSDLKSDGSVEITWTNSECYVLLPVVIDL